MNANISRDVVLDLLPAYLSGEVSGDTRTLIETYMKQDPEFAAQVKEESKAIFAPSPSRAMPDREMEAMRRTKRLLRRRGWFMGAAIFFTMFAISFHVGPEGVEWTWQASPATCVLCGMMAVVFWIAYFRSRYRLKTTGV